MILGFSRTVIQWILFKRWNFRGRKMKVSNVRKFILDYIGA